MNFSSGRPIFQQIKERFEDQVIRGALLPDERVPAVRDYALAMEVNPNTVVRSFLELEEGGVIYKKRGLGYFLSHDAKIKVLQRRRQEFLDNEMPEFVQKMRQLDVDLAAFVALYEKHQS